MGREESGKKDNRIPPLPATVLSACFFLAPSAEIRLCSDANYFFSNVDVHFFFKKFLGKLKTDQKVSPF